jgi:hypothetical protein
MGTPILFLSSFCLIPSTPLTKEILYWILQGPHGEALEQIALEGSNASRIREVIDHIPFFLF